MKAVETKVATSIATNLDEDASTASSTNGSGVIMSNSKAGTSSRVMVTVPAETAGLGSCAVSKVCQGEVGKHRKGCSGRNKVKIYSCLTN